MLAKVRILQPPFESIKIATGNYGYRYKHIFTGITKHWIGQGMTHKNHYLVINYVKNERCKILR